MRSCGNSLCNSVAAICPLPGRLKLVHTVEGEQAGAQGTVEMPHVAVGHVDGSSQLMLDGLDEGFVAAHSAAEGELRLHTDALHQLVRAAGQREHGAVHD